MLNMDMTAMLRTLVTLCIAFCCLESVVCADYYCFRRYVTKVSGCKGIVRRKYSTPEQCCARSNADGYAVALVSLGKKFYECRRCSELKKTTPAVPLTHLFGKWGSWGEWGACSKSCGAGAKQRTRLCLAGVCHGTPDQMSPCMDRQYCPVDGGFGPWYPWEACSASCNGGVQRRQRFCNSPRPAHSGRQCAGNTTQVQDCNTHHCPVDGGWSSWTDYTTCTKTCGNGKQIRSRECNNPVPQHGGQECAGRRKQRKPCTLKKCPIDGDWSLWSDWSACTVTCGHGSHTRTRDCVAPRPRFGGRPCTGNTTETQSCYVDKACPVDGGWSVWSSWSTCDAPACSGIRGVQVRGRLCNNPSPKMGGRHCVGLVTEQRKCHNNITCPSHGDWCNWADWGPCSQSCGSGYKARFRNCSCPEPQNEGNDCIGSNYEIVACKSFMCGRETQESQVKQKKGCSTSGGQDGIQGSGSGGGWTSDGSEVDCDQEDDSESMMNDDGEVGSSQGSGYGPSTYEYPYGFFSFNHLYNYGKYNDEKQYSTKDKKHK